MLRCYSKISQKIPFPINLGLYRLPVFMVQKSETNLPYIGGKKSARKLIKYFVDKQKWCKLFTFLHFFSMKLAACFCESFWSWTEKEILSLQSMQLFILFQAQLLSQKDLGIKFSHNRKNLHLYLKLNGLLYYKNEEIIQYFDWNNAKKS